MIIRALRVFGIDLQKEVVLSIKENYPKYKQYLSQGRPDKNIDHRRVKVLVRYFLLKGWEERTPLYQTGDLLVFDLGGGVWHIAIVSDRLSTDQQRHLIIHNICCGVQEEDAIKQFPVLFCFRNQGVRER